MSLPIDFSACASCVRSKARYRSTSRISSAQMRYRFHTATPFHPGLAHLLPCPSIFNTLRPPLGTCGLIYLIPTRTVNVALVSLSLELSSRDIDTYVPLPSKRRRTPSFMSHIHRAQTHDRRTGQMSASMPPGHGRRAAQRRK